MENKKGSGLAGSLEGKGFYIVLFLCAAVIGVSAWILFAGLGTMVEDAGTADMAEVNVAEDEPVVIPAGDVEQDDMAREVMSDAVAEASGEPAEQSVQTGEPEEQAAFVEQISYVWPVMGEVQRPYSITELQYDSTMADWRTHDGIDVTCDRGTQVMAAAPGTVVSVMADDMLGTRVEIDHGSGVHSIYANLAASPPVSPGQTVAMGQVIGSVGATALGETNQVSHLHFAMTENGWSADPGDYLPAQSGQ